MNYFKSKIILGNLRIKRNLLKVYYKIYKQFFLFLTNFSLSIFLGNLSLLKEEYEALTKKECDIKKSVTEMEDEMRALKCCVDEYTENLNKAKADVRECEEACLVIQVRNKHINNM